MFNSGVGGNTIPPSRCLTRYGSVTSEGYPALGRCTMLQYHFYNATCPHRCIHESLLAFYQLGNYYGRYSPTPRTTALARSTSSQSPTPPTAPVSSRTTDPMDLSAGRRGPLSQKEKAKQIVEGRCLYCGGLGYTVRACTVKPQRGNEATFAPAPPLPPPPSAPSPTAPSIQPAEN